MSDPWKDALLDDRPKPDGGYVPPAPPPQRKDDKKAPPPPPKNPGKRK